MCSTDSPVDSRLLVERIVASQQNRGPDAQRITAYDDRDFRLTLGHNRLSIIDLTAAANQPMTSADGSLHLVFNGEIYNYLELRRELEAGGAHFRTASDTEVVIAAYRAWGMKAFDRFIGFFAIALYDASAHELLLVRDRFGVKPLFVAEHEGAIAFASSAMELARWTGAAADVGYVARGIRQRLYEDDSRRTQYIGIDLVEASTVLRIRVANSQLVRVSHRYYDLDARVQALVPILGDLSESVLENQLVALLRDSCSLRRRSDVPLGISVSGGIDSSAIVTFMTESGQSLIGYSYGDPADVSTEGPMVAELAKTTRLDARFVNVEHPDKVRELFWDTLHAQDAPFPSSSMMAQFAVFRAARADGTIVLLGGQGGDEAFMGYRKFFLFLAQSIVRERRYGDAPRLVSTLAPLAPALFGRAGMYFSERQRYAANGRGKASHLRLPAVENARTMGLAPGESLRDRQLLDVTRYSLPTLLRYEDRNSMGNSVESRLPFLDQRVVEFGIALRQEAKLGSGFGKLILRRVLRDKIPDRIRLNRDKRGFDVNHATWIRAGLGDELRAAILTRRSRLDDLVPKGVEVKQLFSDDRLIAESQAFQEAVTLIWLGDRR
jgi:asparagine synthase (glutamine-hydrolysing)